MEPIWYKTDDEDWNAIQWNIEMFVDSIQALIQILVAPNHSQANSIQSQLSNLSKSANIELNLTEFPTL